MDGKVVYTLVLIEEAMLQIDCEFDDRIDICNGSHMRSSQYNVNAEIEVRRKLEI